MLGLQPWETILYAGTVTVIFSALGGFKGVVYTDFILFFTAMAGAIGGGGLGDLAIRYGYQRFMMDIMAVSVISIILVVQLIQFVGDRVVYNIKKKRG